MYIRGIIGGLIGLAALGAGVFWFVTEPSFQPLTMPSHVPDPARGEALFNIGGCASCHKTPGQDDRHKLGGGLALKSPFGTFYAPNISMDAAHGIGDWSEREFATAVIRGVGRRGEHLYPAFPYTSYAKMNLPDVLDLFAYIKTLPAVNQPNKPHEIDFPFDIRRLVGIWKLLFLDGHTYQPDETRGVEWNRGAYLVLGPGHCSECHSPRNALGAIEADKRFSGAPDLEGRGWVPNITHHADGIASWKAADIAEFLKSGLTPDFDSAGGGMAEVIRNTGRLSGEDRKAMAAYLVTLPPIPGKAPKKAQ